MYIKITGNITSRHFYENVTDVYLKSDVDPAIVIITCCRYYKINVKPNYIYFDLVVSS